MFIFLFLFFIIILHIWLTTYNLAAYGLRTLLKGQPVTSGDLNSQSPYHLGVLATALPYVPFFPSTLSVTHPLPSQISRIYLVKK